ncbi:MAG: glycosyltransferase family 4 protein [Armatimonadetes bacterium]|nr:glycosyltransferase family 4 protein [Armatimonadota bacterium]
MRTLQIGMEWFPEEPGGLNRYYMDLIRHLPACGVEVRGLVAGSDRVPAETGGRVHPFPRHAPLVRRLLALRKIAAQEVRGADLVVGHFAPYTLPFLPRLGRRPLVVHFHGPWSDETIREGGRSLASRAKASVEHTVYRRAAAFVVLSRAFGDLLAERYRVAPEKVTVIPSGVEVERFDTTVTREEARARLGWPSGGRVVLAVRRLVRRMGLENLIEAMRIVRREVPDAAACIAGAGPLRTELEERIRGAGLQDAVRLLGVVPDDDLIMAYRAADFTVVPTVALEGFGIITIESLACGRPVLVTPVGGLPEAVRGLSADLVMASSEATDIAAAISAALCGPLALPDEAACRQFARDRYDWPVIASRVAEVYRNVLSAA